MQEIIYAVEAIAHSQGFALQRVEYAKRNSGRNNQALSTYYGFTQER